VGDSKFQLV